MLELVNIHKSYGDVRVLNGVYLRLRENYVYTLKSSVDKIVKKLIDIIFVFVKSNEEIVKIKNRKINHFLSSLKSKINIGKIFQDLNIFHVFKILNLCKKNGAEIYEETIRFN